MAKDCNKDQFPGFDRERFAVIRCLAPNIVVGFKEIDIVVGHILPLFGQESSFCAHSRK
jgi:hypothetical protein